MVLSMVLWVFITIMGVMLFIPKEQIQYAARETFWIILAWNLITTNTWIIGGWMNFVTGQGITEQHFLCDVSPFRLLLGRVIPLIAVQIGSFIFMGLIFNDSFHTNVFQTQNIGWILLGIVLLLVSGISYGLIIASISLKTSISGNFLEIFNFLLLGIFVVNPTNLPYSQKILFLLIPYTSQIQLIRVGLWGYTDPYMLIYPLCISFIQSCIFVYMARTSIRSAENWVRKNGIKTVGWW